HPSFNVWYMNGQTSDYNSPSNHRVLGGGLKNVRMTMGPNCAPQMLFQQPFLADASIYSRVEELGLTFEYDQITIIDQRAGDTGFFPARGSGSMKNINSNKSVGFGDDVIKCQTENINTAATWRNRRTYKVRANSTVIRALENTGVFSINLKSPNLEVDNFFAKCYGDLFIKKAGEPYNFTIKIFDGWAEDLLSAQLVFKLKIKAQVRHSNAGQFDYLEKEYEFFHNIPATSSVNFPLTAIYTSGPSGVANESLAFTLSNPQQAGRTQSINSADWFVSIDVAMSSGRTNPFYSAQYELEVRKVN
ncbi:MAG: hypothetical protein U1D69_12005, partial [Polynucleobacter sp.]|nr:hypothetical protein [Polynucleobacter sp.]